jgi:XTP/dITP diphosphohydrolase
MRLVLASGNRGKAAELAALLAPLGWQLVSQAELGVAEIEETGATFEANALLKARHAAATTGLPALADDSGLEVDALDGAPGVRSARYAGGGGDAANLAKLLRELEAVPDAARGARFRCVLAFVADAADPTPLIARGAWQGRIARAPRGSNGFGYDPVFLVPDPAGGGERSAAELDPAVKNERSHRGQALRELLRLLAGRV